MPKLLLTGLEMEMKFRKNIEILLRQKFHNFYAKNRFQLFIDITTNGG